MKARERSVGLKGWAIALALALVILPAAAERLLDSAALAGQENSNQAQPRTRRARKITSNGNQSTDRQTGTAAAQNANSQPSNSNTQQPRAYRVEAPKSNVKLENVMTIGGKEVPLEHVEPAGTEITYTTFFTNQGTGPSHNLSIIDPIQDRTDFKLGSFTSDLGTTGLRINVNYSKDGGEKCDYTPVSGGGGAPEGFDRLVNAICVSFSGDLSFAAPNNAGSFSYVGRRR